MKRIVLLMAGVMLAIVTHAQMSQQEIIKNYIIDINESVELMQDESEAWNQGEAFSEFIKKFATDEEFMNSRIRLTPAQATEYKELLVPSNFEAKHPFQKEDAEEEAVEEVKKSDEAILLEEIKNTLVEIKDRK